MDSRPGPVDPPGTDADKASPVVASVVKAAAVLKAFTPAVSVLSVRQVAVRTGIPRATAHTMCRTLAQVGLLEIGMGGYRLGPLVLDLGGQVIERTGLVRAAEGILDRLIRAPEEEVHLGQLAQGWVVYLDREAGPRRSAMRNRVGQRAPAHLTGCGKAALSWLPLDEVEQRIRQCCAEERTRLPDLDAIAAELGRGRRDGYVISQSFQQNRTSVGAAILDARRRPVGGVSVAGPAGMFTAAVLAGARASVVEAAGIISSRIVKSSHG